MCLVKLTEPSPVDYELNQYEQTEQLLHVEDDEVPVKRRHDMPSQRKRLPVDNSSVKHERGGKLLAIEEFKRRALINMMDGVLEKRWEDELKKDVPKPQCMVFDTYFFSFKILL